MSNRSERNKGSKNLRTALAATTLILFGTLMMMGALMPAPSVATYPPPTPLPGHPIACAANNSVVMIGNFLNITGDPALNASLSNSTIQSDLNYNWTFFDKRNISILDVKGGDYIWRNEGIFLVTLNVTDNKGDSSLDHITVKVIPKAEAGASREFMEGSNKSLVPLDASLCRSNGNITNYTWTVFDYEKRNWTMYGEVTAFNFTKHGTYRVMLTITDDLGYSSSDNLTVHVLRKPTFYEKQWILLFIDIPIILIAVAWCVMKYRRDKALVTPTDIEKARLQIKNARKTWKVFRANRLGFAGFVILIIFVVMAIFAPFLSTVPQPTDAAHHEGNHLYETPRLQNPLPPSFTPSPYTGFVHPFGTDHLGQDVYSMTLYGSRASLEVGLIATFISVALGATIGLMAGYFGRITDEVLMRTTDFFLVLPWFPLMIVMMAILGQKFIWVVVVIGLTSWPSTARIVRSQVLTIKERQFIVRAKAVGSGDMHIIQKHIMPNVLPLIFANTVLLIALAIFSEAFLDFFGLGDTTVISWGAMLEAAYNSAAFNSGAWWWIGAPGAAIVIMVLSFSLVGYAIDDVLNPKLRRR
jgi:peptide/nickel transport system permease protein